MVLSADFRKAIASNKVAVRGGLGAPGREGWGKGCVQATESCDHVPAQQRPPSPAAPALKGKLAYLKLAYLKLAYLP